MRRSFLHRWFVGNTLLAGAFALGWLLLRSGARPSRLAYPCQQAAISTATLAFGAPLVAAALALRRRLFGRLSGVVLAAALIGLVVSLGAWEYLSGSQIASRPELPRLETPDDYRAQVFHVAACPEEPIADRFPCLDLLLSLMGSHGLRFYESALVTPLSGPDGILAADDTIIIKINYQWPERGGTNTDLLRGLIRAIVNHPDGFTGEIVICENAQFVSVEGFDRGTNNAQDIGLSPHDVVSHFQDLGFDVSLYDWTAVRGVAVDEYADGDYDDGYVLYPFDPQLAGRVSYPKFETAFGTYVSLRDGIWRPASATYDRQHLKLINLPVLKSHSIYGVTANVKDYMGVVTGGLGTNSHNAIQNGLLGAHLGALGLADLNILDAIWVNGHPDGGPSTTYGEASRRNELVASTDPVAADLWATRHVLIPAFEDNGYSEWPRADPNDPSSRFREYLDNSTFYILAAGLEVTNDPERIDVFSIGAPLFADDFESGDLSSWSDTLE